MEFLPSTNNESRIRRRSFLLFPTTTIRHCQSNTILSTDIKSIRAEDLEVEGFDRASSCHNNIPQTIELELAIIFLQKLSQSVLGFKRYIIFVAWVRVRVLSFITIMNAKNMWSVPCAKNLMILLQEKRNYYHLRIMKVEQEETRLLPSLKRFIPTTTSHCQQSNTIPSIPRVLNRYVPKT